MGTGRVIFGALTSAALAAALIGSAPTANATCVSAFGISSSAACSSNLTSIAIAIGPDAAATANGLFGAAFAMGDGANAVIPSEFLGLNIFNAAIALGDGGQALARGIASLSFADGVGSYASTRGVLGLAIVRGALGYASVWGTANTAINLGDHVDYNWAQAYGTGNLAVNLSGDGRVVAGFDTNAVASVAFNTSGTNTVKTVGGPLAIAGSVHQDGATVSQSGPGVNINNGEPVPATARADDETSTRSAAAISGTTRTAQTDAAVITTRKAVAAGLRATKKITRPAEGFATRSAAHLRTRQQVPGRHADHRKAISKMS